MTTPGLGGMVPDGDDAIMRKLRNLEDQIRELRGARTLENAEIGVGGLKVTRGGSVQVIDPATGGRVFFVGDGEILDGSGRRQMSFMTWRDDGTAALQLSDGGTSPGHSHQQALLWFDRGGRIVVSDDTVGGSGLANPHVESCGMQNTNTATWPATNATAFTTIASAVIEIQNPRLTWQVQTFCDAGVTAQFRMLCEGVQIGTTQNLAASTFGYWSTTESRPSSVAVGDVVTVSLQAKVSATTGSARAVCYRLGGWQS